MCTDTHPRACASTAIPLVRVRVRLRLRPRLRLGLGLRLGLRLRPRLRVWVRVRIRPRSPPWPAPSLVPWPVQGRTQTSEQQSKACLGACLLAWGSRPVWHTAAMWG